MRFLIFLILFFPNSVFPINSEKPIDESSKAISYFYGFNGFEKNYEKSYNIFNKIKNIEPSSYLYIATMYKYGYFLKQNYELAEKYYTKAYDFGYIEASYELGLINYYGLNGSSNEKKAIKYFVEAGQQGDHLSQYMLGLIMEESGSYIMARRWYIHAAESSNPDALYNLGQLYLKGLGGIKSKNHGESLISTASKLGHIKAINYFNNK